MVQDTETLRREKTNYTLVFEHILRLKSSQRDRVFERALTTFAAETHIDEDFLSDELFESLFMEWLLFDFDYKAGKSMLEHFVNFHPASISAETIDGLRQSAESNFVGDFWIERVDSKDDIVTLSDIGTGEEFEVLDHSFCKEFRSNARGIIGVRLICIDEQWLFAGNPVYCLPIAPTAELREIVRDTPAEPVSFIEMIRERYGRDEGEENDLSIPYSEIKDRELRLKEIAQLIDEWHDQKKISLGWEEVSNAIKHDDSLGESPSILLKRLLFVEKDGEVDLEVVNMDNIDEILNAVVDAWNLLPHDCFGGSSPIDLIEKQQSFE